MERPAHPDLAAPRVRRRGNPLARSKAGVVGLLALVLLAGACLLTLPWTLGSERPGAPARYEAGRLEAFLLPPTWAPHDARERERYQSVARARAQERVTARWLESLGVEEVPPGRDPPAPTEAEVEEAAPFYVLGTDKLGRDVFVRCLLGGAVSIGIGIAAAGISVLIGTLYGSLAAYAGGRVDSVMMRIVDVLYGLPYILLVVLLAVVGETLIDQHVRSSVQRAAEARAAWVAERTLEAAEDAGVDPGDASAVEAFLAASPELVERIETRASAVEAFRVETMSEGQRKLYEVLILLAAIGGVSWLTMARVIRGQVLSLKARPFMEAARASGVPLRRQFALHLLPNLVGPIVVYATLTVPQAILQESFLSFLGIGVQPPLPSWGNLASDGLVELNSVKARWWLITFPCVLLGATLLALNFLGEGLREAVDPRSTTR